MNWIDRGDAYLTIPNDYGLALGGPRWSLRCDAVEWPDGSALALTEELQSLLDGVFSRTLVPPFVCVLNALHLMKSGVLGKFDRLRRAFESARGAAGLYRNTGLLIAELCADVPASPDLPSLDAVRAALRLRKSATNWRLPELADEPPLTRFEFEQKVAARLERLDDEALAHWLRYGTPPPPKSDELAKAVESLPVRVAKLLHRASKRPRLVGAATLAPVIDAALTLPPRRRTPDPLPQGGYADVTTRGEPERLLPGQFALDADEFVRRFAENELLYFEREEPHAAEKPGRILVLDQGVRTWGSVRLALAAATLALLKKDPKRIGRVRLAATSSPELIDLADADLDALADVLEASDLTASPAACLTRALADDADPHEPRDVVVLTHPRALREGGMVAASKLRRPTDRIFALGVDETGKAEFAEWSAGGLIPVRTFRIDLALGEGARVAGEPPAPIAGRWDGDAEPIPFPFRPGLVAEPLDLGFDAGGEWLVIVGRDGILHALGTDKTAPEVLPRAFRDGVALKQVHAVLGVRGGVVVCGQMPLPTQAGAPESTGTLVAAHYDRATRRVALHNLNRPAGPARWLVYPDLNTVVVRIDQNAAMKSLHDATPAGVALDLSTLGRYPGPQGMGLVSRARTAWDRSAHGGTPPLPLPTVTSATDTGEHAAPHLFISGNSICVRNADPAWTLFEPTKDGRPSLQGCVLDDATFAGETLCVLGSRGGERHLLLFRAPGAQLGELSHHRSEPFALSPDGLLLARRRWHREVVVSETRTPAAAKQIVTQAALHNGLGVRLDATPFRLVIRVGGFEHAFGLSDNRMSHELKRDGPRAEKAEWLTTGPLPTDYDTARFPRLGRAAAGPLRAVPDRLGQVLLLTATGGVVAAFVVRRDRAAAWLPGDTFWGDPTTFWGDPTLIGGPPTPNADRAFGAAILSAGG